MYILHVNCFCFVIASASFMLAYGVLSLGEHSLFKFNELCSISESVIGR